MSVRWIALALLAALACKRSAPPPPPEPKEAPWPAATADAGPAPIYKGERPDLDDTVAGKAKTFMVTSESVDATKVGRDVLATGGNAVDAAIATAFALAVTHPTAGNLGGGGFAVVRTAPGKALALDFRETAPAAATETMYLDKDGKPTDESRIGHRASGIPGATAGMWALHQKWGKKPWKELVEPAAKLARDGFALDAYTVKTLSRPTTRAKLEKSPATMAIWFANGTAKEAGTIVKIPELAKTLERIRDNGPDGFYKGETAAAIVAEMTKGGGLITAADLAGYKVVWREPLRFAYRGRSIVSMPPPSSGGIVLAQTAGILKGIELGKIAWYGPEHLHRLAEVWKRAFSARNEVLADPAFVKDLPVAKLMSTEHHDKLAKSIGAKATPSKDVPQLIQGIHTTHLCVVDSKGMAVALTTTLNGALGGGVTIPGGGFLMNNEMDDFTAKPGSPNMFGLVQGVANKIEPGKRMLSSMSPTIVEDDKGELVMLAGAGGGPKIITAVWQTISNVIDHDQPIALAVAAPRIHQQDLPDHIQLEPGAIDKQTEEALRGMGHTLKWGDTPREFGAVTAIARTATGWEGTADPRGGGAAIGD